MCGIVGIITKNKTGFYINNLKALEQLLFVGQLRGTHGTGIFYNNKKQKIRTLKSAMNASEFISIDKYAKAEKEIYDEASFVIGHNRYATKGAHTVQNTHPFREGNITLVHNGTLVTHKDLADVEVDSHAICISMNKIGAENTIKKINGAFALVWHDALNNTLNLCRNSERPLALLEHPSGWVISSEIAMGEWIADRNNIKISNSKNIPINTIISFNLKELTYTEKPIKVYEKLSYYGSYTGYNSSPPLPEKHKPPTKGNLIVIQSQLNKDSDKKVYPKSNMINVGDQIELLPIIISSIGDVNFLECIKEQPGILNDIDVRFYSSSLTLLESLEKCDNLVGTVSAIVSGGNQYHLVVRDVMKGCITKNGHVLHDLARINLPHLCHCCGGHFSHMVKEVRKSWVLEGKENKLEPYCIDCTEWTEKMEKVATGNHEHIYKGEIQ